MRILSTEKKEQKQLIRRSEETDKDAKERVDYQTKYQKESLEYNISIQYNTAMFKDKTEKKFFSFFFQYTLFVCLLLLS